MSNTYPIGIRIARRSYLDEILMANADAYTPAELSFSQCAAHLGSHAAIPVLGDRERIVRKPDGVCRSYPAAPDAALQPKRKSCDRGVIPDTLDIPGPKRTPNASYPSGGAPHP